jgi:hypothetical protein
MLPNTATAPHPGVYKERLPRSLIWINIIYCLVSRNTRQYATHAPLPWWTPPPSDQGKDHSADYDDDDCDVMVNGNA